MAYKMKIGAGTVFNIDSAVGVAGANRTDDVMLVQFLLGLWGADHLGPAVPQTDPGVYPPLVHHLIKGVGPAFQRFLPAIDGNCDSVTKTWIMMFQMCHKGGSIIIDGRVDPIMPSQGTTLGKNTMALLNSIMATQGFRDMPEYVPPPLIQATRTVRS